MTRTRKDALASTGDERDDADGAISSQGEDAAVPGLRRTLRGRQHAQHRRRVNVQREQWLATAAAG